MSGVRVVGIAPTAGVSARDTPHDTTPLAPPRSPASLAGPMGAPLDTRPPRRVRDPFAQLRPPHRAARVASPRTLAPTPDPTPTPTPPRPPQARFTHCFVAVTTLTRDAVYVLHVDPHVSRA